MAKEGWKKKIDKHVAKGGTVGKSSWQAGLFGNASESEVIAYANKKGYTLGQAWADKATSKTDAKGLVAAAGPTISKKEYSTILDEVGGNVGKALNKIEKGGAALKSGVANMLIKEYQKSPFNFGTNFGKSGIGQTIMGMTGTPDYRSAKMQQSGLGSGATPGTGLMIKGTVINPGGKVAIPVKSTDTSGLEQTISGLTNRINTLESGTEASPTSSGTDLDSILNAISGLGDTLTMPEMEMPDFSGMFEDISSQFDIPDPIQLLALGQAYGGDLIRARQRPRKTRGDYLRDQLALGTSAQRFAPMAFGGGVTI